MPVSMTYFTPGIVRDVSAMFVASITFLCPGGAGLSAFICWVEGNAANNGQTTSRGSSRENDYEIRH